MSYIFKYKGIFLFFFIPQPEYEMMEESTIFENMESIIATPEVHLNVGSLKLPSTYSF